MDASHGVKCMRSDLTTTFYCMYGCIIISIGMGYGGAWGAKKFGAFGSLIGMGAGLFAGCGASNLIKRLVLPKENLVETTAV